MHELIEERTLNSKTFQTGEGQFRTVISKAPIHFEANGQLRTLKALLVPDEGGYRCETLPFQVFIPTNKIGFEISWGDSFARVDLVAETLSLNPVATEDTIWFIDCLPDVDIGIAVSRTGVKTIKRVKSAQAQRRFVWDITQSGSDVGFSTPEGRDNEHGEPRRLLVLQSEVLDEVKLDGTINYKSVETWTGEVLERHPETRVLQPTGDPIYPVTFDPTVGPIASDSDDGDELVGGSWTDRSYRWYTGRSGGASVHGGVRFLNVTVPQGATITSATLTTGEIENFYQLPSNAVISADAVDNAPTWSDSSKPSSGYTPTTATVTKSFSETSGRVALTVTAIVQEVVNRAGWASGNAMRFAFKNDGTGNANSSISFDADDAADSESSLTIDYSTAAPIKQMAALGVG